MGQKSPNKQLQAHRTLLYASGQTPPPAPLFFSSLQHMLLVLSLGMAMPISVARAAGLDLALSASLLAASLFCMGISSILQTMGSRYLGSGYQSLSVSNSAALSASILAAQVGGIPLLLGMTIFSGLVRFVLSFFIFPFRKLFPTEVTGTMVFILGINLVPTALENFLGSAAMGVYNPMHLVVAVLTLLFMLSCSVFFKRLKPYTTLLGIVFGFLLSAVTGIFDISGFRTVWEQPLLSLPVYTELEYRFDFNMLIPFLVISISGVVDNIGDFTACQNADDPNFKKPNWRSIENGSRAVALGTILSGLLGGAIQSTATTNIGISKASGITSRRVAYVAGIMLIVASVFPALTGLLSMIPTPVLGAVLLYSGCYIMAGGFSSLSSCVLDDKRIFSIFLSIFFAISTLIPGLYDFVPEKIAAVLVSPMVMGVCVLMFTTLLTRIGTKRIFSFRSGTAPEDVHAVCEEIEKVCAAVATERRLMRIIQIAVSSLCEGLHEFSPHVLLDYTIRYDSQQLKICIEASGAHFTQELLDPAGDNPTLAFTGTILNNMFDNVKFRISDGILIINMNADI